MTGDNGLSLVTFINGYLTSYGSYALGVHGAVQFSLLIADRRGFIVRMGLEVNIARNELGQLNSLIAGLEASEDVGEVWDTIKCLRDKQRKTEAKLADLQHWLTDAEEEIVEKQKQLK
ncbi:hypothetical protein Tco_0658452 [Tanacetum coccineum]